MRGRAQGPAQDRRVGQPPERGGPGGPSRRSWSTHPGCAYSPAQSRSARRAPGPRRPGTALGGARPCGGAGLAVLELSAFAARGPRGTAMKKACSGTCRIALVSALNASRVPPTDRRRTRPPSWPGEGLGHEHVFLSEEGKRSRSARRAPASTQVTLLLSTLESSSKPEEPHDVPASLLLKRWGHSLPLDGQPDLVDQATCRIVLATADDWSRRPVSHRRASTEPVRCRLHRRLGRREQSVVAARVGGEGRCGGDRVVDIVVVRHVERLCSDIDE
jgi:hypothetical protein